MTITWGLRAGVAGQSGDGLGLVLDGEDFAGGVDKDIELVFGDIDTDAGGRGIHGMLPVLQMRADVGRRRPSIALAAVRDKTMSTARSRSVTALGGLGTIDLARLLAAAGLRCDCAPRPRAAPIGNEDD